MAGQSRTYLPAASLWLRRAQLALCGRHCKFAMHRQPRTSRYVVVITATRSSRVQRAAPNRRSAIPVQRWCSRVRRGVPAKYKGSVRSSRLYTRCITGGLRGTAQTISPSMLSTKEKLVSICQTFKAPVKYSFGYGSGVFSQGAKSNASRRQIDIVLGVENAAEWHAINIEQNPHHYSGIKHLGSPFVAWVQNKLGAGVYYNPFVRLQGEDVKYGVVELEVLRRDLLKWDTLYLAGRMQKPVKVVKDHAQIAEAQRQNLRSAMSTALLLLPEEFSEFDLYMRIAGVSYMGDVRMAFAENPRKVQNIVSNQFSDFRRLYQPLWKELGIEAPTSTAQDIGEGVGPLSKGLPLGQQADSEEALLRNLPERFRNLITKGNAEHIRRLRVSNAVARIVKWPSLSQSAKGLLTAGLSRSFSYSVAKVGKSRS